ncbi:hypothetical protein [Microbispora bryophytorum]|uniref:hypothetical protein n=1 Tax=Microbispora bryophytorum TaxID=1460882 RepID=UPI0033E4D626
MAELLDAAAERRAERERRAAALRAEEETRRERERPAARERVDLMIGTRKPGEYDAAVELLVDLRTAAERVARLEEFTRRLTSLRREHSRKPSLMDRLDRAGLVDRVRS